jgi:hypothetical protein
VPLVIAWVMMRLKGLPLIGWVWRVMGLPSSKAR